MVTLKAQFVFEVFNVTVLRINVQNAVLAAKQNKKINYFILV